nr:O-antigen ligase family protein [Pseudaestuariivita rosea]
MTGRLTLTHCAPRWHHYAFVLLGIALYSRALDRVLSGNPSHYGIVQSSLAVQIVAAGLLAISGLILVWRPSVGRLDIGRISVAALTIWIFLSALWSADAPHSLQKALSHLGVVLFAFASLKILGPNAVFQLLVRATAAFVCIQFAIAILAPAYAFHNAWDLGVGEHAGRFRGSFFHKNETGRMLGLALLILMAGRTVFNRKTVWWGLIAMVCGLLIASASAKLFLSLPAALIVFLFLKWQAHLAIKTACLVYLITLVAMAYHLIDGHAVLESLIGLTGRDLSLSGRDAIWSVGWPQIVQNPMIGAGYDMGWSQPLRDALLMIKGPSGVVNHAHNGYFQTMLDLGAIGVALALLPLMLLISRTLRARMKSGPQILVGLIVPYILLLNITGSYLTLNGDIFMCLTIWLLRFSERPQPRPDHSTQPSVQRFDPSHRVADVPPNLVFLPVR